MFLYNKISLNILIKIHTEQIIFNQLISHYKEQGKLTFFCCRCIPWQLFSVGSSSPFQKKRKRENKQISERMNVCIRACANEREKGERERETDFGQHWFRVIITPGAENTGPEVSPWPQLQWCRANESILPVLYIGPFYPCSFPPVPFVVRRFCLTRTVTHQHRHFVSTFIRTANTLSLHVIRKTLYINIIID